MQQSAIENLNGDFAWFPNLLVATAGNPIFALFVGLLVSLFVWRHQTLLSHKLSFEAEKRDLYRQFIRQIEDAIVDASGKNPYAANSGVMKIFSTLSEIELVSNAATSDGGQSVMRSVFDLASVNEIDESKASREKIKKEKISRIMAEKENFVIIARLELRP